ncbi:hypothetical protein WH95_18455 [Kiloniella litopenaei]|uniref:Uncharacterized protein n=1 Tax=Kiloniella litopenaei TaxID=1549748 RepID=A0A0M2R4Q2_9PROT|nr:hypothetical protein [Kiloniella litopenaei]KKJ75424.1 hypothetical protein WH95_18455 [Kiloniella litopenaei]
MYKVASRKAQSAVSRMTMRNTSVDGISEPTDKERRENLVSIYKVVVEKLTALPKKHPKRAELAKEAQHLQGQIKSLGDKKKFRGIENYFIDEVKRVMPPLQFKMLMNLARENMRKAEAAE